MRVILTMPNGDQYHLDMINGDSEMLGQWLLRLFKDMHFTKNMPAQFKIEVY